MKVLAILFFIGVASASFYDALEKTSDNIVSDFMLGMERTASLTESFPELGDAVEEVEDDIKTALGKSLKAALDDVLAKIRDTVNHGKEVSNELVNKAKEITDKLKEMGVDAGNKAKELVEKIKEKARDWLKGLLEKIGIGKRSITDFLGNLILSQLNVHDLLEKLKEKIAEKADLSTIIDYVKKLFGGDGAFGKMIIDTIKAKGIEAIKALVKKLLGVSNEYSLISSWEALKEFFKGLGSDITEKAHKFTEWLKEAVKNGLENAKDKTAQLKAIAQQVISHSKTISKEAAREALAFFEPYKNDLGALWDQLKESVHAAIGN